MPDASQEDIENIVLEDGIIIGSNPAHLQDLSFYLNGRFDKSELVRNTIQELGGEVLEKWSVKAGKYITLCLC